MIKIKNENKQYNILIIEDNKDDIFLIDLAIKGAPINSRLEFVNNGNSAICLLNDLINSNKKLPDLIFLDINLPKETGLDVLKKIKSERKIKSIPTVVLTSSDSMGDMAFCYENGADLYLRKPNNINDLKRVIKEAVQLVYKTTCGI